MSLDSYKILNGTLEKRFNRERRAMAEGYNQSSAQDFFYVYRDAPLPFILLHSRDIFSETFFGYPFYRDLISNAIIDPEEYQIELSKVIKFIEDGKAKRMPMAQLNMYEGLSDQISDMVDAYSHITYIVQKVKESENGEDFLNMVFNGLYDVRLCELKYVDDERCLGHTKVYRDYIAEAIFTTNSPYAVVVLGLLLVMKYPSYAPCLVDITSRFLHPVHGYDAYGKSRRALNAIKYLMKSGFVAKQLANLENPAPIRMWSKVANTDIDALLPIPVVEATVTEEFHPEYDGENIADLDQFIESLENDSKTITSRYDVYRYHAEKLDADNEFLDESSPIYENNEDLQNEYEAQCVILEWEADGTPNSVIQTHIMTTKERAEAEEAKRKEKQSPVNNLETSNAAAEKRDESESELCEKIKKSIEIASKLVPADTEKEKADNNEVLSALRTDCKRYRELIDKHKYENAKKLYDELREEILAADSTFKEESNPITNELLRAFLEDDDPAIDLDDEKDKKPDGPPKHDIATKIQNKALDYAAKDQEKADKSAEDRQKLKNAANAVSQKPKRQIKGLKDFVASFDKWDENRRKKFMLKPGFRHRLFKLMRNAIILGAVSQVKLALVPLLGLISHCSKLKDDRIRTELTRELENEIKICEEKINDANSEGDKKSKYELMRIRDKLEAEKVRVKINSKFI